VTAPPLNLSAGPPQGLRALRLEHLAEVLEQLARSGPQTRACLARAVGLSRTSLTSIAAQLVHAGVVLEQGPSATTRLGGRPGALLALRPDAAVAVGIDHAPDGFHVVSRFIDGRVNVLQDANPAHYDGASVITTHYVRREDRPVPSGAESAGGAAELGALAESDAAGMPAAFITYDGHGIWVGAAFAGIAIPSARAAAARADAPRLVAQALGTSRPATATATDARRRLSADVAIAVDAVLACIYVTRIVLDARLAPLGHAFLRAVERRAGTHSLAYAATGPAAPAKGAAVIGARQLPERLAAEILHTSPTV
jgi:hypothetical protein